MKITSRSIASLILLVLAIGLSNLASSTYAIEDSIVSGTVLEAKTGKPISSARIILEERRQIRSSDVSPGRIVHAVTDSSGKFRLIVNGNAEYRIFIVKDFPDTPGLDFVPAFASFVTESQHTRNFTFELIEGASVLVDTDGIYFVESPWAKIGAHLRFTVVDPTSRTKLSFSSSLTEYGSDFSGALDLELGHVVVPAGIPVRIEAEASARVSVIPDVNLVRKFTLDSTGQPFLLRRGELARINPSAISLETNFPPVEDLLNKTEASLEGLEQLGAYLAVERIELSNAWGLIELARNDLESSRYAESYSKLREAYIELRDIERRINEFQNDAIASAFLMIPFVVLVAWTVASFLCENRVRKTIFGVLISLTLWQILTYVYVGFRLVEVTQVLAMLIVSIIAMLLLTVLAPRLSSEKPALMGISIKGAITSAFSIGKRNLRRRRLRSLLTLLSIAVLVAGFVSLTSVTFGYGLVTVSIPGEPPGKGLLLMNIPESGTKDPFNPFLEIPPGTVDWLRDQPNVEVVAPKIMNVPQLLPLGTIRSDANATALLRGYLGIDPNAEAKITFLERALREGRYLTEHDTNAVLISLGLATKLGVKVSDRIHFFDREFTVVGLFDDAELYATRDLDGWSIVPKKIVFPPPALADCQPDEIVVVPYETATTFPFARLAKVDVKPKDAASLPFLARLVAFSKGLWAWWNLDGKIRLTYVGSRFEVSGSPVWLLLTIVSANVFSTMLNAVYERRKEIATLSTLGLNPSHISAIFIAESIIVGIVGGGLGYIAGLSTHRIMSTLHLSVPVEGKFAVHWALGALGIALLASLIGAAWPALKTTARVTPSRLVKWKLDWRADEARDAWIIDLPMILQKGEVESFIDYFRALTTQTWSFESLEDVEVKRTFNEWTLTFNYRNSLGMETVRAHSELVIRKTDSDLVAIKLLYFNSTISGRVVKSEGDAYQLGTYVRKILLDWSEFRRKPEKGYLH